MLAPGLRQRCCCYRFAFGFLIFVVAYVCWLLVKYYQSYVILRQHYLMGGEKQINEWHQQFLDSQEAEVTEHPSSRTRSRHNIFAGFNRVLNPNVQASLISIRRLSSVHYCHSDGSSFQEAEKLESAPWLPDCACCRPWDEGHAGDRRHGPAQTV